jgi:hypothetical protein
VVVSESEKFWLSVIDDFDGSTSVLPDDSAEIFEGAPSWVTKLAAELMTMLTPRLQLRVGDRATPEKVGRLVGSGLTLIEKSAEVIQGPAGETALKSASRVLGGFDVVRAARCLPQQREMFRASLMRTVGRILDRPEDERCRFFKAIAQAIQPRKRTTNYVLSETQKRQRNTISVYGVTLMNWQKFDRLTSSRQAYDTLCKILPVEIVGHDAERIRRMFSRLGKTFRQPGRPHMK